MQIILNEIPSRSAGWRRGQGRADPFAGSTQAQHGLTLEGRQERAPGPWLYEGCEL